MTTAITITLASIVLKKADKKANIAAIEQCIGENTNNAVDMFLFPELSIIGGMWKNGDNDYKQLAENIPDGPSCKIVTELAKKYNTSICAGITEEENGEIFITHFICTPEGFAGKQRKLFPHDPRRSTSVFSSGQSIAPIPFNDKKIAVLACADFLLPEPTLSAGLAGCDMILSPTDCFDISMKPIITNLLRARAMDIGGYAFGVFGNDFDTDHSRVLASFVADETGEIHHFATKKPHTSSVSIATYSLPKPQKIWGGFQERDSFLKKGQISL